MLQTLHERCMPFCLTEDKNVCKYAGWSELPFFMAFVTILNLIKNLWIDLAMAIMEGLW